MGDDHLDIFGEQSFQEAIPSIARRLLINQHGDMIFIERTNQPLEFMLEIIVEMKPAKDRSDFGQVEWMAFDEVDDYRF